MTIDYCIVGLGNPGARYHATRHNIGFAAVDFIAEFFKIDYFFSEDKYAIALSEHHDKTFALVKPLTFMNMSGPALTEFLDNYDVQLNRLLVIYDDVNLEFGTLRLRPFGSDGGQKGMHSIIYELMTENIPRLRIGIRNENSAADLVDYVLSEFTKKEKNNLQKVLTAVRDAVLCFIDEGIGPAMNKFNKKVL